MAQLRTANLVLAITIGPMAAVRHSWLKWRLPATCGSIIALERPQPLRNSSRRSWESSCRSGRNDEPKLIEILSRHGLHKNALNIGTPTTQMRVRMRVGDTLLDEPWWICAGLV